MQEPSDKFLVYLLYLTFSLLAATLSSVNSLDPDQDRQRITCFYLYHLTFETPGDRFILSSQHFELKEDAP